jgi:hypothetical protein
VIDPAELDVSSDYAPMSGLDEFLIHAGPLPVRSVLTPNPRAFERMWFGCVDKSGEYVIVVGIGFYPNLDAADAFAIVNRRGLHTTVRGRRRLGVNRVDMAVGPIRLEVVEPFQQWRLSLGPNDYGIGLEIDWFDSKLPTFREASGSIPGLETISPDSGYESFGYQQGWVEVNGIRTEITSERFRGTRDHHWGLRENVGGPPSGPCHMTAHAHSGEMVEFKDFALFPRGIYYNRGDRNQASGLRRAQRRLRFEPETKFFLSGEADLEFDSGVTKHVTFERIGNQIAFLRCGMYGGFGGKGGTPDRDIWHGQVPDDADGDIIEGETYDVNDPVVRQRLGGLDDCAARFECAGEIAYGFVESVHPYSYDAAREGRQGLSILG